MGMRALCLSLLIGSLLLTGCKERATSAQSVGIVDVARLVRDSEPGKAANIFLEDMQKQLSGKLVDLQKKAQDKPEDAALSQEFQGQYMKLQQQLQSEEQNVNNVLLDHILRSIDRYRTANGLSVIVRSEAVMSYDTALDVTDRVMDEVNKQKIEYKPITQDEAAVPAQEIAPETKAKK